MQAPVGNLIFIALLMVIFYFLLIRPQKRRMEAQRALIASVEEGDEIVTMGGILGTVQSVEDDEMQLEIAPGTSIRILRSAVARKLVDDDEPVEDEEDYGNDGTRTSEEDQA